MTKTLKRNLNEALVKINKKYFGNNIIYNRKPEKYGNRIRFTLTVKNSQNSGSRFSPVTHRRMKSACWHVHGLFFDTIFEIAATAEFYSLGQTININGGNWIDQNIGTGMNPVYHSECCECDGI